jgi:hypothetical protein
MTKAPTQSKKNTIRRADIHQNGATTRGLMINGSHWLVADDVSAMLAADYGDVHKSMTLAAETGVTLDEMTLEKVDGKEVVLLSTSAVYKLAVAAARYDGELHGMTCEDRNHLLAENRKLEAKNKVLSIALRAAVDISEAA